jgi:menaquinol-cytochrome c reductase iron-sulfur subunit
MSDSHQLERRDFVKIIVAFVGTVIGTIIGLPAIGYLISPATKSQASEAWIPLGPFENYPADTPTLFSFTRSRVNGWEKTVNSYGAYVVRKSDNTVTVFSNMCTHLACRVKWLEDIKEYVCPCHDGHFDAQGEVVLGPPPEPLIEYETKIEEGNLFIHFVET